MKLYVCISKNQAVRLAKKLVISAKKEIVATMNVDEEYVSPLPQTYHDLLSRRVLEGIRVTRYGFGSKRVFSKLHREYGGVEFLYVGLLYAYQRMLIIDGSRGMFALGGKLFYTDFVPLASHFVKYIKIVYNKEDV